MPATVPRPAGELLDEVARRRTFAIISHPDAGKTTLTEKLLLFAGAVREAGMVRARRGARATTSDWMELERQRGISVSSTVIRFEHRGHVFNLLDTPGHADFGEDTYRTLCAADSAVLLLDAAKGLEPQALKLFDVCRARGLPLLTFLNKLDRPALPPLALLDGLERLGVIPVPMTWPVGDGPGFGGVVDRRRGEFIRLERRPHGATRGAEERFPLDGAPPPGCTPESWTAAREELAILEGAGEKLDRAEFLAGRQTPVFFGSAVANFGVATLLEILIELAPPPLAPAVAGGEPRPLDASFSAFVFKLQANMNPQHRDRVAFLRVCSGRFERGMTVSVERTGRRAQLAYAHGLFGRERETLDEAVAGDIVAVVNAGLQIGDTLFTGPYVRFPPLPSFPLERFAVARNRDVGRYKQFRRGLAQLADEGVVHFLVRPAIGEREPILGAAGELQLEVARFRMAEEFGCEVELEPGPWKASCPVEQWQAERLPGSWGTEVVRERAGALLALFPSQHLMRYTAAHLPELGLRLPEEPVPARRG